jgi:hypothetical protein
MHSLIGDRFLKRFFGSYLQQGKANPVDQKMTIPENPAEGPAESDCSPREDVPIDEAAPEQQGTFRKGKSEFKCKEE